MDNPANILNHSESRCDDSVVAMLWLLDHFWYLRRNWRFWSF